MKHLKPSLKSVVIGKIRKAKGDAKEFWRKLVILRRVYKLIGTNNLISVMEILQDDFKEADMAAWYLLMTRISDSTEHHFSPTGETTVTWKIKKEAK